MATNLIYSVGESDRFTEMEERPDQNDRKVYPIRTHKDAECYSISYEKMGQCHVFAYRNYKDKKIPERINEPEDTRLCEEVFEKLGYEVFVHRNLTSEQVGLKLSEIQSFDHSDCSSLVMILMSHGDLKEKTDYFNTYDDEMKTSILWEELDIKQCPSLAGKPKLFFIQTCRGKGADYGAILAVVAQDQEEMDCHDDQEEMEWHDTSEEEQGTEDGRDYVISSHSDMMIMFASYEGMLAFGRGGKSVFIHYLCEIFREEGTQKYLSSLLFKITQKVALMYESRYPEDASRDKKKQIPQTKSTLMREVCFDKRIPKNTAAIQGTKRRKSNANALETRNKIMKNVRSNSSSFEASLDGSNISRNPKKHVLNPTYSFEPQLLNTQQEKATLKRSINSTLTQRDDDYYNMEYEQKAQCHVFAYENYEKERLDRKCAPEDISLCEKAFKNLGYDVRVHKDLKRDKFLEEIKKIQCDNHMKRSSLVMILMTHGELVAGAEYFHTYDETILTSELWESFTADNCPTLTGKPKLFFIQACRGDSVDCGAGQKLMTDNCDFIDGSLETKVEQYVIPSYADNLIMFASYTGIVAYRTIQNDIKGSIFIHFLSEVLCEEGTKTDLSKLLLKITRKVVLEYESSISDPRLSSNKQTPQTISTLIRDVRF